MLLLAALWGLTCYLLVEGSATVPIHFNLAGRADGYGSKMSYLLMPIFATLVYGGLTLLVNYPHTFNYATEITPANAAKQYAIATRLLRAVKVVVLFVFFLGAFLACRAVLGSSQQIEVRFLPLTLLLLTAPIVVAVRQSLKKQ